MISFIYIIYIYCFLIIEPNESCCQYVRTTQYLNHFIIHYFLDFFNHLLFSSRMGISWIGFLDIHSILQQFFHDLSTISTIPHLLDSIQQQISSSSFQKMDEFLGTISHEHLTLLSYILN